MALDPNTPTTSLRMAREMLAQPESDPLDLSSLNSYDMNRDASARARVMPDFFRKMADQLGQQAQAQAEGTPSGDQVYTQPQPEDSTDIATSSAARFAASRAAQDAAMLTTQTAQEKALADQMATNVATRGPELAAPSIGDSPIGGFLGKIKDTATDVLAPVGHAIEKGFDVAGAGLHSVGADTLGTAVAQVPEAAAAFKRTFSQEFTNKTGQPLNFETAISAINKYGLQDSAAKLSDVSIEIFKQNPVTQTMNLVLEHVLPDWASDKILVAEDFAAGALPYIALGIIAPEVALGVGTTFALGSTENLKNLTAEYRRGHMDGKTFAMGVGMELLNIVPEVAGPLIRNASRAFKGKQDVAAAIREAEDAMKGRETVAVGAKAADEVASEPLSGDQSIISEQRGNLTDAERESAALREEALTNPQRAPGAIAEVYQSPLAARMGAHRLTTPEGDRLDWRETPEGAHISDVTVQVEKQGTGTAMLRRAIDDARAKDPNAIITADLNSESGARLFAKQDGAKFFARDGTPISAGEAIVRAKNGEGPTVELHPTERFGGHDSLADQLVADQRVGKGTPAEKFLARIHEKHPTKARGGVSDLQIGRAEVKLVPSDVPGHEDAVLLDWISTPGATRQGHGSKALDEILDIADETNTPVILQPEARSTGRAFDTPLDDAALYEWYSRHGFESDYRDETVMRYEPGSRQGTTPREIATTPEVPYEYRQNTVDGTPRKPDVRSSKAEVWQREDGTFDVVDRQRGGSIVDLGDRPKGFDAPIKGGPEDGGTLNFRVRPDPREPVFENFATRREALDAYEQIKRGESPPDFGEGAKPPKPLSPDAIDPIESDPEFQALEKQVDDTIGQHIAPLAANEVDEVARSIEQRASSLAEIEKVTRKPFDPDTPTVLEAATTEHLNERLRGLRALRERTGAMTPELKSDIEDITQELARRPVEDATIGEPGFEARDSGMREVPDVPNAPRMHDALTNEIRMLKGNIKSTDETFAMLKKVYAEKGKVWPESDADREFQQMRLDRQARDIATVDRLEGMQEFAKQSEASREVMAGLGYEHMPLNPRSVARIHVALDDLRSVDSIPALQEWQARNAWWVKTKIDTGLNSEFRVNGKFDFIRAKASLEQAARASGKLNDIDGSERPIADTLNWKKAADLGNCAMKGTL